jgi:uncharacterized membrane protein YfcA
MNLLVLALATFVGAAMIRLTGLGFSLVASPFFAVILGPLQGVLLLNFLTPLTNIIVLAKTRAHVEWRRAFKLALPAICVIPLGSLILRFVAVPILFIALGVLVLVAIAVVVYARNVQMFGSRYGAIQAGAASGLMNSVAGLGGPALTLYALATKWPMKQFVATVQVYYLIINAGFLLVNGLPVLDTTKIAVLGGAIIFGIGAGDLIARRVSDQGARHVMLALAMIGAITVIIKGLMSL